jgi:PAS domain S-box-containing protein
MNRKPRTSPAAAKSRRRAAPGRRNLATQQEHHPMMAELRRRAEVRLREHQGSQRSEVGGQRLLHELQVHQVELEMQNAELQEARDRMELLLEKYTDLYDFAPVGYFSLDEQGRILEVNLTGAALLGVDRSRLNHRPLSHFVATSSQPSFLAFLGRVFAESGKQFCEGTLLKEDGGSFWASLHGTSAISVSGPGKWCRVGISDITSLKQAEDARRRVEALAVSNRELRREIVRREAVEEALKDSQQRQTRLLEQSRHMQEQLRHLSHQILQAQEEERKRISRELHDEITQTLVGISVQLESLARSAGFNPQGLKQRIVRTQRLVEKSVEIVHQFARELRPTALDDLGLIATLHGFMKDFTKRTGIRVHFLTFTSGLIDGLDNATRTVFYRVAQEALTNVARHARATQVKVSLRKLPGALRMEIADDGKSFQVERVLDARKNKRLGLLGMRERVEMVGGSFAIESAPGQGTTIRAQIPFRRGP